MGKTSKFSFPYPGRKRQSRKTKGIVEQPPVPSVNVSKAQRILGAEGDLNIDSPTREDGSSWRACRPSSSNMSIALSESIEDDESACASNDSINWGKESGVLPGREFNGKVSTVLGHRHFEEAATNASSLGQRLHAEHSSSTLRSYYDRQKASLLVSQQTSASSVRDRALRKGFPQVVAFPQNPLMEVEFLGAEDPYEGVARTTQSLASQSSKKKPARLDLSRLFPKPRKDAASPPSKDTKRSSLAAPITSDDARVSDRDERCKLTKTEPEGKQQPLRAIHSEDHKKRYPRPDAKTPPRMPHRGKNAHRQRAENSTAQRIHTESTQRSSPGDDEGPSNGHLKRPDTQRSYTASSNNISRNEELLNGGRMRRPEPHRNPTCEQPWEIMNVALVSPQWETRSFTSLSSQNTKGSRRTSASVLSNSDLNNNSVLSISSDEDTDEETDPQVPRTTDRQISVPTDQSPISPRGSAKSHDRHRKGLTDISTSTKISHIQDCNFLTIPPPSPAGSRISGPWNYKPPSDGKGSIASSRRASSITMEPRQPSPPLSTSPGSQSRLMAVTKQEEALLEALRQKRARMKETIIAEHETRKPPPRALHPRHETRDSKSSILTVKPEKSSGKERILLYLDQPISDGRQIDTAEPSPDLSDFLSFGSDEDDIDSTPRTSWLVAKDQGRPDSITQPEERCSPVTLNSAARLSAVGALGGLLKADRGDGRKRGHHGAPGVAFLDNVKGGSEVFLDDENAVWNL
jgi:hypothetical protein